MPAGPGVPCVVLAGGLGTRLRGVVGELPKCLAPVGPRAFIDFQLDALYAAGVPEVVLSLGYGAAQVIAAVTARHAGRPLRWVVEPAPLGTGGAIAHVLATLDLPEVLVVNGDTYLDGDLSALDAPLDRAGGELLRMALVHVDDRGRYGGVEADAAGRVRRFIEKGRRDAGTINAGLYRLARAALPAARAGAWSLEAELLPALVERGAVNAVAVGGGFIDIGVPEDYRRFCAEHG